MAATGFNPLYIGSSRNYTYEDTMQHIREFQSPLYRVKS